MRSRPLVWSLLIILVVAVGGLAAMVASGTAPLLGLDLKGGVSVVEQPQGRVDSGILQEAVDIIDRRVNGLGVSNSNVTRQGNDIVIELPGAKNDTQVLKIVGQTAQLFFRPVECLIAAYQKPAKSTKSTTPVGTTTTTSPHASEKGTQANTSKTGPTNTSKTGPNGPTTTSGPKVGATKALGLPAASSEATLASFVRLGPLSLGTKVASKATTSTAKPSATTTTTVPAVEKLCSMSVAQQAQWPTTPPSKDFAKSWVVLPYYVPNAGYRYVLGPAEMSGSIIKSAVATIDPSTSEWVVAITFTSSGSTQFDNYAARHYQCYEQDPSNPPYCAEQAIELDGTVQSAPNIEAPAFHGSAQISGSTTNPFTQQQATDLALALRYGSLPVRFVPQSIESISPTIGSDSLVDGAIAGAVAIALVLIYLMVYYRALGLVVVLGICVSGALVYTITALLGQAWGLTLTLSGVIGLIVSVGVTADSCVIYFERLKEDVRSGRTVRTSVEKGFNRAFRTILAADFSSFLGAMVLWLLTVGDVRGFAFFLGLATLLNVVTTYFFTRPLVILLGRRSGLTEGGVLGVNRGLGAGAFSTS
ncbi:MAG: protein translocase subunit SecD [Acidimicrobiales bacterium]